MKLSSWVIRVYLACGVLFVIRAAWEPFYPKGVFSFGVLLLAAAYCLLCVSLVERSRDIHRSVMLMASLAILVAFVLRILVLTFDDSAFQFPNLMQLSSDAAAQALWFMAAGTVAFWLGARLALNTRASNVIRLPGVNIPRVSRYRNHLIAMGLAIVSTVLVINIVLGVQWIGSEYALLMSLLPVDILAFALMYLAVEDWKILTLLEKAGVVAFFIALFVSGVAVGSRTALVIALLPWLTAAILSKREPKVGITPALVAGGIVVLVFPFILGFISEVRDLVRGETIQKGDLMVFGTLPSLELWGLVDVGLKAGFRILSDRMAGFDTLVVVMNYRPQGIEPYLSVWTLAKATLDGFVPDSIWSSDAPPTGSVFATFYQGFPWGAAHHGAWSGFGFLYAYFGPVMGILVSALLGAFVTLSLRKLVKGSVLLEPWTAYFLYSFVYLAFVSGNMDIITSGFVVQGVVISSLLWLLTIPHRAVHTKYAVRLPSYPTSAFGPKP